MGRQVPIMIQQQMELHGPFCQSKLGPGKHRGAEIDHRGVQTQQRVLETELRLLPRSWLVGRQGLTLCQYLVKHGLAQLLRPMFVGVRQRGASRSCGQTQMTKLSLAHG
jgi:hypothetical protein